MPTLIAGLCVAVLAAQTAPNTATN